MVTIKVENYNCIDFMKEMPDNSVDLIIADPPYNISKLNDNRDRSKLNSPIMRRESPLKYDFGEWDNKTREEFLEFTKSWLIECCRVLKNGGTIISFFNKEDISYLGWTAKDFGIRTRTIMSWHKTNPVPSFRKVNYLSACEFLWIGSKGDKAWTFNFKQQKEMHNFFQTANKSSYGETEHPTEKPLSLIKYLMEIHSKENDLVLDPFLGGGTTAVASKMLNRNCIGIELSEEYCKIANERLTKLNDGNDGIPPKPKDLGILPTII
jgi:DNA modification methylase